jgi:hypothetical protein
MKKIDWDKLAQCVVLGILVSFGIVVFGALISACIELMCMSLELGALIICFISLVIGITYWAYKNNIIDD